MRAQFKGCVSFKVGDDEYEAEVDGTIYDHIYGENADGRLGEARSCVEFFVKSITKLPDEQLSSDQFKQFDEIIEKQIWGDLINV